MLVNVFSIGFLGFGTVLNKNIATILCVLVMANGEIKHFWLYGFTVAYSKRK